MKQGIKYNQKKKTKSRISSGPSFENCDCMCMSSKMYQVIQPTCSLCLHTGDRPQLYRFLAFYIAKLRPDLIKQPLQFLLSYPLKIGLPAFNISGCTRYDTDIGNGCSNEIISVCFKWVLKVLDLQYLNSYFFFFFCW